jgi:hypothetical protein
LARLIVLILYLFRLAGTINFRKDYSSPSSLPSQPYTPLQDGDHIILLQFVYIKCMIEMLCIVHEDGRVPNQAVGLIQKMECFRFVFILVVMLNLLGITNELSCVLQTKGLNIVIAL